MRQAALAALSLHVLLLLLLPPVKNWNLPPIEHGLRLNVVLEQVQDKFDQSLNYPSNTPSDKVSQASSLNIARSAPGEDDSEASQSDEVTGTSSDSVETKAVGLSKTNSISPSVLFSYSSIMQFARQEAVKFADVNPNDLRRFNRSFNSRRQYQRRKKANSYTNQYGDQYVKNGSSNGDICFLKTAEGLANQTGTFDANTYTVHFFRCSEKEQGINNLGG